MPRERILIVEDDTPLREVLRETLRYDGFEIQVASNGIEALQKMDEAQPDLILSDISMPKMDGLEFFKAVRRRPQWVAIPFIFLTARGERDEILTGKDLGAEEYLVKPTPPDELRGAIRARLARSRQILLVQLRHSYQASLTMLANAIEVRDRYTRGHVERVMAYSVALAEQMNLDAAFIEHLRFGAILHDVGKIHVRESILCKNEPLTEEEWQEIRRHPVNGVEMIGNIPYLIPALPAVRSHHERWDGDGYPDGLAAEEIPMAARIVAVADTFDAMTTERAYRPALSLQKAYEEILLSAGRQFDPAVVAAFRQAWQTGTIQSLHEM